MKFQKTAIAAIVAGFAAAPMMASADTVLSGVVQVKFTGMESDDDELQEDLNLAAGDVRAAIASEHELNSGLIGYGNLQINIDDLTGEGGITGFGVQDDVADPDGSLTDEDLVELDSAATVSSDNVYVGIKGGFGDIRLGEIPLAVEYGQLANDIHDVGTTVPGGLSYTGTFGVVGFGLNYSPELDSDMIGAGLNFNFAGATIGLGFEERAERALFAVGASYAIAGFSIAAHTWSAEDEFDPELTINTTAEDQVDFGGFDFDDQNNIAVQVGYAIAGVNLGLTFSILESDTTANVGGDADAVPAVAPDIVEADSEETIIRFDAGYDLGGGMDISTRIQNKSTALDSDDPRVEDPDDSLEYRVVLSKTF